MRENAALWFVWFTSSAMRWIVSRRMGVRMTAAGVSAARMCAAGITRVTSGIAGVTSAGITGVTSACVAGMSAACGRMIGARRPDSASRPGYRSRSSVAL